MSEHSKPTQNERVVQYIEDYGSITQLDAHAPEATTDLSDAPEEIKEEIISNAKLLEIRDEQSAEVTSTPKTSGLEFFTDEELLAEISRRMAINA